MPSPTSSDLSSLIAQLHNNLAHNSHTTSAQLLTKLKVALLHAGALAPSSSTSPQLLAQAQQILELGALISIQLQDSTAFMRYYQQLQPFYDLPPDIASHVGKSYAGQRSKVTGLYLLLLLSQGDYAGFHTVLEGLEKAGGRGMQEDEFIRYPVRLESWLMEGSYDRVWSETKGKVPCEEFAVFSNILIHAIRNEVASCSEKAYTSIPIANAKNLLFLDSEGSVVEFGRERGWQVVDGRVEFPREEDQGGQYDVLGISRDVIENTLGYARELETIV